MGKNLNEFLATYNPHHEHPVTEIEVEPGSLHSPFIVVRHGSHTVVINPMAFDDHLCIDLHPFVDGQDATAGAFGMSEGSQVNFPDTGTTSHGWPSTRMVAVLVGEQADTTERG